jgi:predicted nucleic acid-binding protein
MATLIDSNVLIDVLEERSQWAEWSARHIARLATDGELVINQIVYGEVSVPFPDSGKLDEKLSSTWLKREDLPWQAAFRAGKAHAAYRKTGGKRISIMPDFLIGAHAEVRGYQILTRDARQIRYYFPGVNVIAPDTHP